MVSEEHKDQILQGVLGTGAVEILAAQDSLNYVEKPTYLTHKREKEAVEGYVGGEDSDNKNYLTHAAVEGISAPEYEDVIERAKIAEYAARMAEESRGFYSGALQLPVVKHERQSIMSHECLHKLRHMEQINREPPKVSEVFDELNIRLTDDYNVNTLPNISKEYDVPQEYTEVLSVSPDDYENLWKKSTGYGNFSSSDQNMEKLDEMKAEEAIVRYLNKDTVDLAEPDHAFRGYGLTRQDIVSISDGLQRLDKEHNFNPKKFLAQTAMLDIKDLQEARENLQPVYDNEEKFLNGSLIKSKPGNTDLKDRIMLDIMNNEDKLVEAAESVEKKIF